MSAPHVVENERCVRVSMDRRWAGHISFGGEVVRLRADEQSKSFTFEWHSYFGPSRCNHKGDICADPFFPERSGFWPLFERWMDGGKMVDAFGFGILAPPRPACDASCEQCKGRGWFKIEGDRRKHACNGLRKLELRAAPSPSAQTETGR